MPQPTTNEVHVDSILTNLSVGFMQEEEGFVADRVFPVVPVQKQSDKYFLYDKSYWYRAEMEKRAPATESAGGGFKLTTDNYYADVWALHKDIDNQTEANVDDPINLRNDATSWLSLQALLRKDKLWMSEYFTTGKWTGDQTGVAGAPGANQFQQFDQGASLPFQVIEAQRQAIKARTGYFPNKLVLGSQVWAALKNHAAFIDRIKYTQAGFITTQMLASALEIDEVIVASGVENTAAEGATPAYSFLAGKSMLLVYAAPRPSIMQPSGGYTFAWTGLEGAGALGNNVSRFDIPEIKSERVELEIAFDQKLVAAELGVFFATAVA